MVDPVGLEPTTSRLQGECSPNDELWAHMVGDVGYRLTTSLPPTGAFLPINYSPKSITTAGTISTA